MDIKPCNTLLKTEIILIYMSFHKHLIQKLIILLNLIIILKMLILKKIYHIFLHQIFLFQFHNLILLIRVTYKKMFLLLMYFKFLIYLFYFLQNQLIFFDHSFWHCNFWKKIRFSSEKPF